VNRYGYNARSLFIPYALANLFTLITVLLGVVSYHRDGVLPDRKFQDFVSAAADPRIIHVVRDRRRSMTLEVVQGQPIFRPGEGFLTEIPTAIVVGIPGDLGFGVGIGAEEMGA
jgi:hypothetical protein